MFFNLKSSYGRSLDSLKRQIDECNWALEIQPDAHDTLVLKVHTFLKISQLSGDEAPLTEALNGYNQAILMEPANASYIIDRATSYINLRQNALAARDLEKVKSLPHVDDICTSSCIRVEMEKIEEYLTNANSLTLR